MIGSDRSLKNSSDCCIDTIRSKTFHFTETFKELGGLGRFYVTSSNPVDGNTFHCLKITQRKWTKKWPVLAHLKTHQFQILVMFGSSNLDVDVNDKNFVESDSWKDFVVVGGSKLKLLTVSFGSFIIVFFRDSPFQGIWKANAKTKYLSIVHQKVAITFIN